MTPSERFSAVFGAPLTVEVHADGGAIVTGPASALAYVAKSFGFRASGKSRLYLTAAKVHTVLESDWADAMVARTYGTAS